MKILIVEDEQLAVEHLEMLLRRYDPTVEIVGKAYSVQTAVDWLSDNEHPDIAFFDIQLADGLSFEIVEQIDVRCPIIFATAFNEYTLKAFKVNSIDYLLKPYDLEDITKAIEKYRNLKSSFRNQERSSTDTIKLALQMMNKEYKSRFLIKSGSSLISVPTEQVHYFFHKDKIVWLRISEGKKYSIDYTLEQLDELLDPKSFFRINRKYIIGYNSFSKVTNFTNSRLKIALNWNENGEDIIVSRERVNKFKSWLDG